MKIKAEPSWKHVLIAGAVALVLVLGLTVVVNVIRADAICNQNYPYPGCTEAQIKELETGSKQRVSNHYIKNRWGQSNNEWAGLNNYPALNTKLKNLYEDAVRRYNRAHSSALADSGMTTEEWNQQWLYTDSEDAMGMASAARYPTWNGFKAASGCAANVPWSWAWCAWRDGDQRITKPVFEILMEINKMFLYCGGKILVGDFVDKAFPNKVVVVATNGIKVVSGAGKVVALTECAQSIIYDAIWKQLPWQ